MDQDTTPLWYTEVDFGPGHIVLDGDTALPPMERGIGHEIWRMSKLVVAWGRGFCPVVS